MKLLLDSRRLILAINNDIELVNHEGYEKWKIGTLLYYMNNDYILEEVDDVPIDIIANKYFFINGEFVINPNWSNVPEEIQEMNKRINEILLKKAESELDIDERLSKLELGLV